MDLPSDNIVDAARRRVRESLDELSHSIANSINPIVDHNASSSPMLRRAANVISPTPDQPAPLSPRRRLSASIRRRLGRITRSKSSGSDEATPRSSTSSADESVPKALQDGIFLTKISTKRQRVMLFRLDPDRGQLIWESKVKKYVPVEAVRELRAGADAKNYREQFQPPGQDYEDRWLTIIYMVDSTYKTMHLLAQSKETMDMWNTSLRRLHAQQTELMSGLSQGEMLEAVWERHYWNGRGFTFEDVERLCRRLNVNYGEAELRNMFQQAGSNDCLDFEDFGRFAKLLKTRPDVERLYKKLTKKHERFGLDVFQSFMRDVQRSTLGTAGLQALFDVYSDDGELSLEGFTTFLFSAENPAFADPPAHEHEHKHHHYHHHTKEADATPDMTRPLSEYFISSSHNTYLSGHQLVGESTIEGYVRALQAGCRCVELDIHPGNPAPLVTHGNTLTSKLSLRAVCEAIDQYAFIASPYPLIISAEVHCSPAQQDMLVDIMTSVFGDKLVRAPVDGRPPIEKLPSPHDLRGRILLKAKNLYVSHDAGSPTGAEGPNPAITYTSADSTTAEEWEWIDESRTSISAPEPRRDPLLLQKASAVMKRVRSRSRSRGRSTQSSESSPPPSAFTPLPPETPKPKMSAELLTLLVYTVGVKYRGINKKEEYALQHMFSLSENTANKLVRSDAVLDLIKHNRTHLVRIYPKGTRLKSSNYLPHNYWSAGAQLVAINWQTVDLGYMMNHAMFHRNGGLGYVLKPRALRLASHKDLLAKRTEHVLELGIISAQQLPPPKDGSGSGSSTGLSERSVDPFIEVLLYVPDWNGFQTTSARSSLMPGPGPGRLRARSPSPAPASPTASALVYRTSAVKNNGFNPVWEEKLRIPFSCVGDMLDLVFVKFAVRQDGGGADDEPLAVYCAPLACLQQGYRHLPLYDSQLSQYMFSTLFVRIGVRDL